MNPDFDLATAYMDGLLLGFSSDELVWFIHEGVPVSKSRARWNMKQRRFFTPAATQSAEQALGKSFMSAMHGKTWAGNVAVVAVFFRPNHHRIDADNLMKLVLDAGTKARVWNDDSQVTKQLSVIELDREHPRTLVGLARIDGTLSRFRMMTLTCETCGKEFERDRFKASAPRTCSPECRYKRDRVTANCARCGSQFERLRAGQRYCSRRCAAAEALTRRPAELQRPAAVCEVCGARVSRREYRRCAGCSPRGRKPGSKNKPKVAAPGEAPHAVIVVQPL